MTGPDSNQRSLRDHLLAIPAPQLEERLAQLDRLANMGTLAAVMAHEIKNALVAGRTFTDLLLEKNQDAELVNVVRRELGRIDAIVGRMLKFGGPPRSGSFPVHLHDILDHSLRLVEPQLGDKCIALNRSFGASSDSVRGDDYQLQQALVNLLLNALEAMGPHGTLSVTTESLSTVPAKLRVSVGDTGVGIRAEHMPRLFEPFFTTKSNGTGLGLPITRRIILEHGGEITAESQPGNGTTFHILLPVLS